MTRHQRIAATITINGYEGIRQVGDIVWFEYHCWEDKKSQDFNLWQHSHQKVKIIDFLHDQNGPWLDRPYQSELGTPDQRAKEGFPVTYAIQFADGLKHTAGEDELLDSPSQFERPDCPYPLEVPLDQNR